MPEYSAASQLPPVARISRPKRVYFRTAVISISGAASSTGLGSDLLVPAIAAALVGGTAITGGTCNPINVVFGAMLIALIPVATNAVGVSPLAQSIVYGLVLVVAVAATMGRSRTGILK